MFFSGAEELWNMRVEKGNGLITRAGIFEGT